MAPKIFRIAVKALMVIAIIVFVFARMSTTLGVSLCFISVIVATACLMVLHNSDETGIRIMRKKQDPPVDGH